MRAVSALEEIGENAWNALLASQSQGNPFLSYAFLHALQASGSASPDTGWHMRFLTLWDGEQLAAALPAWLKTHSYGEYVFDWAWAEAYQRHGLAYYPKLLSAIPFTPVTGPRLLARDLPARAALIEALHDFQRELGVSSTHILFPLEQEAQALAAQGFMLRRGVQFHWENPGYRSFEDFLAALEMKKRKNIRAERRKVHEAGVSLRRVPGSAASEQDWCFFKRCYDNTYAAHYSTPYLNLDFFLRIARSMPEHLLLIIAEREGMPIAASLVVHDDTTLFGRYWGELAHVPCLHFEAAYYQPLEFCIERGLQRFEGGAQGEHKMARGFLPTSTCSAHWLAHPDFADAVERFLVRETGGIEHYLNELQDRQPFRSR